MNYWHMLQHGWISNAEWTKFNRKEYVLYASIYIKFWGIQTKNTVAESSSGHYLGKEGYGATEGKDYKGAQGNSWQSWICSLFWLCWWWTVYTCQNLSNYTYMYIYMQFTICPLYLNKAIFKNKTDKKYSLVFQ